MTDRGTRIASSPQRLAILDALRLARGPLDAAQIRKLVPSAKVGFNGHMRALEEAGAVVRDGKSWLTGETTFELPASPDADDPDWLLAVEANRTAVERRVAAMRGWLDVEREPEWERWRAAVINLDGSMCLNPAQLSALEQRLRDVIAQFRAEELTTEAPDAEDVLVILSAVPMRSSRPI